MRKYFCRHLHSSLISMVTSHTTYFYSILPCIQGFLCHTTHILIISCLLCGHVMSHNTNLHLIMHVWCPKMHILILSCLIFEGFFVTQHTFSLFLDTFMSVSCHTTQIVIVSCLLGEWVVSHNTHSHSSWPHFWVCLVTQHTFSFSPRKICECVMPHNTHFILYWFNWDYIMTYNTYSKFFHHCVPFDEGINVT